MTTSSPEDSLGPIKRYDRHIGKLLTVGRVTEDGVPGEPIYDVYGAPVDLASSASYRLVAATKSECGGDKTQSSDDDCYWKTFHD
jgi:hypothetical protein